MDNNNIKPVADVVLFSCGKTLLVKYNQTNKYDHQQGWFVPDDLMQHAEHPEEAAERILKEQLGITGIKPKLGFVESFIGGDKSWHLIFHYYAEINSDVKAQPSGEISQMEWFETGALPDKKEIAHHGWARYIIGEILNLTR